MVLEAEIGDQPRPDQDAECDERPSRKAEAHHSAAEESNHDEAGNCRHASEREYQTQKVTHSVARAAPREQELAAAEMKQLRNREIDAGKGGKHQRREQPRRSGHA